MFHENSVILYLMIQSFCNFIMCLWFEKLKLVRLRMTNFQIPIAHWFSKLSLPKTIQVTPLRWKSFVVRKTFHLKILIAKCYNKKLCHVGVLLVHFIYNAKELLVWTRFTEAYVWWDLSRLPSERVQLPHPTSLSLIQKKKHKNKDHIRKEKRYNIKKKH